MLYKELLNDDERTNLPLDGPSNYRVVNNIIYTRSIEINATKFCNLSCKGCSHSSPITDKHLYLLDTLNNDITLLSKFLRCEIVRVVGGEPLLHDNLALILKTIKESDICKKICLVTNGLLLDKVNSNVLKYIDKIEISLYPLSTAILDKIVKSAYKLKNCGIEVSILHYNEFRESIAQTKTNDYNLAQIIYESCQIAHSWRCITVDNGKLFRCPQSMVQYDNKESNDYIILDKIKSYKDILSFLENNKYLDSCFKCLGSIGKKFNHEQVLRKEWYDLLPLTPEDGVDWDYAKILSKQEKFKSDCFEKITLEKE